jgi:hypothetical protein
MKRETRKIYRALLSFYKSTIIPMIRWRFVCANFFLKPENLLGPVGVNGTRVLERVEVLNFPLAKLLCTRKQSISQLGREYRHVDGLQFQDRLHSRSVLLHPSRKFQELALSVVMTMTQRSVTMRRTRLTKLSQ